MKRYKGIVTKYQLKKLQAAGTRAEEVLNRAYNYIRETHSDLLEDEDFLKSDNGKPLAKLLAEMALASSSLNTWCRPT